MKKRTMRLRSAKVDVLDSARNYNVVARNKFHFHYQLKYNSENCMQKETFSHSNIDYSCLILESHGWDYEDKSLLEI
jgi:hypothetical protein